MRVRLKSLRDMFATASSDAGLRSTARRPYIALSVSTLLAFMLLFWSTWDQVHTRFERERALAVQVTGDAAENLVHRLQSIESRLLLFVNQERALLDGVLRDPDSPDPKDNLWSLLQLVFPEANAALVLDSRGIRGANLGDSVDEQADLFLRAFARGEEPSIRIEQRNENIQADFAASWFGESEPAGVLLLSLSCMDLCEPEALPTIPPGHRLSLSRGASTEPTTPTDKDHPERQGDALASLPLSDTGWMLEDRLDPDYASKILYSRLTLAMVIGAVILLATITLYHWVRSEDRDLLSERLDLRESRLKLQAILSATTDGFILTDLQGRIELFNPSAEMMFGRLIEDVLDTDVFKLLPDFFSSENARSLLAQEGEKSAQPIVRETLGWRKGGKEFPTRLWVSNVRFGDKPHILIVVEDLTEHQRSEEHLLFLEQRDVLTGLYNRKEFEQRLAAVFSDSQRNPETPHVLCYIDVDRFNLVNDTCGHEAGDELLKQLAMLIKAKLSLAEIIGRIGGDEFGALFTNRSTDEVGEICDGLMQTVRNFLFTWRDQSFDVAVSIGLNEFTPDGDSLSNALSKADVACHMAKTHGRNRIHVYHEGDAEMVRHHGDMRLVTAISQALSEGRFHLYAQPILPISASGGERRHFEILVRMMDESGNPVIPDQFIPAAERYILMPAVDRWIVNRLFSLQAENLRAWHEIEPETFLFAVNLSGTSISDEGFLRYLKRQFADWDVPHRSICFEITETAAVRDLERAQAFMAELGALGCSFALDDFGTGLSSYSYLKELPVDYLKVDGSFVRGMSEDPVNYALVESITQIGHVLGLKTIAEWAEDRSTLNLLRALNVDFAQGFGVGEPIPVCDLTLSDTTIPSIPESLPNDQRRRPHRAHRSTA